MTLGELKHLSIPRKRNQTEIPSVAASERGTAQTCAVLKASTVAAWGLQGMDFRLCWESGKVTKFHLRRMMLERSIIEGDSPVVEKMKSLHPSS